MDNRTRHSPSTFIARLVMMALLAVALLPASSRADDEPAVLKDLDNREQAVWNRHWGNAARNYILFNGEFMCIRGYNERYPSSRGVSVSELMRRDRGTTLRVRNRRGSTVDFRVVLTRPEAEAQAMALPEMTVGQYGYIHSVEVERILSPDAMIVRNVWLIDAQHVRQAQDDERQELNTRFDWHIANELAEALFVNRRKLVDTQQQPVFSREFVLRGYSTDSLSSGMRWNGPRSGELQIALLAVQDVEDNWSADRGKRRMLVAVPASLLKNGLDRDQFLALLAKRQLTPRQIITLIDESGRNLTKDVEKVIVDAIEARAPKLAETPE